MIDDKVMRETAELLLKTNAVTLRTNPPYKWVSGILAPIYTDNRLLLSYPAEREKILELFLQVLKTNNITFDVVAGVSTSGIPWAAWIAKNLNKPMVYARSAEKDHGKGNLIEGKLESGSRVIVIEDLISTGSSSLAAVDAIRKVGCNVECCVAIFTYELEKAINNFQQADCKLITLTNFSTLVEIATGQGYLKDEDKKNVLEWSKNPDVWGR